MIRPLNVARKRQPQRRQRPGLSAFEVFVALTLLSAGLTLSAQLVVRHQRLLIDQRQYRLALDELSNQLERLASMPAEELPEALENLSPTEGTKQHLPDAALEGSVASGDLGQQLTLSISWQPRNQAAAPLTLSAWLYPQQEPTP